MTKMKQMLFSSIPVAKSPGQAFFAISSGKKSVLLPTTHKFAVVVLQLMVGSTKKSYTPFCQNAVIGIMSLLVFFIVMQIFQKILPLLFDFEQQ